MENKVTKIKEITATGNAKPFDAFYVFLVAKSASSGTSAVLSGVLSGEVDMGDFPIGANYWNPVIINSLNVTTQNLSDYRIFAGQFE